MTVGDKVIDRYTSKVGTIVSIFRGTITVQFPSGFTTAYPKSDLIPSTFNNK